MRSKKELTQLLGRNEQNLPAAPGFRKQEFGKYSIGVFKDADNVDFPMKNGAAWNKPSGDDNFTLWISDGQKSSRSEKITFTDSSQVSSFAKKLYDIAKKKGVQQNLTASDYEKVLKMWLKAKRDVQYGGGPNEYD